jgi:hypothetical protein
MNIRLDIYIKIILVMAILVNCSNCGAEIYKSACFIKRSKNLFCGNECRVKYMKGKGTGEDNPNFGKKWDDERKKTQSEIIKSKVDDEYRLNCAKGMKGKEVKAETKEQRKKTMMEKYGKISSIKGVGHSIESKEKIGQKSRDKFTPEFKKKHYQTMVERGIWIEKLSKNPYHFYRDLSNWKCNVISFHVIGFEKAIELGFYNHKTNKEGLVRDHRYSRMSGFSELVFPEILRHPFNCEFVTLGDNTSKHYSKSINSNSITLNELFEGIKKYTQEYDEQQLCLEKIKQYEEGLRYEPNNYIEIY